MTDDKESSGRANIEYLERVLIGVLIALLNEMTE